MSRADLPQETPVLPANQKEDRPLFVILASMAFFMCLTALLSRTGLMLSESWQNDLSDSATVQVYVETEADIPVLASQVQQILQDQLPQAAIETLSEMETRDLLRPWLGNLDLPEDLPIPILFSIDLQSNTTLNVDGLSSALNQAGIDHDIDDHMRWSEDLKRTWNLIYMGLWGIIILVFATHIAIITFATGAVLKTHRATIDIMNGMGAPDSYIIRLFTQKFAVLGFKAIASGAVFALLIATLFLIVSRTSLVTTGINMKALWLLLILVLALTCICAVTAGLTTRARLSHERSRL